MKILLPGSESGTITFLSQQFLAPGKRFAFGRGIVSSATVVPQWPLSPLSSATTATSQHSGPA
jgi:hypothetical protein